jgi:transposase InsO family protein
MAEWAVGQVGLHFIPAGEPWRNGYIESFNSRIRDECLNSRSVRAGSSSTNFRRLFNKTVDKQTVDINRQYCWF